MTISYQPSSMFGIVGTPTTGQSLVFDGTNWVPQSSLPVVMSYETAPSDCGFDLWSYNPEYTTNSTTATTGRVVLARMWVPTDVTITQLGIYSRAGGTGGTALANAYLAIFDKNGNRLGVSANQATYWGDAVNELKMATLTEDATGSLSLQGGIGEYVFAAYVLGTQSTTVLTLMANAQQAGGPPNAGLLTAGTPSTFKTGVAPNAFVDVTTGRTSMPTSIDMSLITATAKFWFGAT